MEAGGTSLTDSPLQEWSQSILAENCECTNQTLGRTYPSRPPSPAAARGASRQRWVLATGAHDRAPVVEGPG